VHRRRVRPPFRHRQAPQPDPLPDPPTGQPPLGAAPP
jgi:hypothetical protein